MIVTLDALSSEPHCDVCIAGSGPAGLSLALALAERGFAVIVIEGGNEHFTEKSQDIYKGEVVGDPYFYLDASRLRQFGGTSNHWQGWCRPLDPIDFERKSYAPDANWPITKSDLDPYLSAAARILNVSDRFEDGSALHGVRRIAFLQADPIPRFGEKFRREVERSSTLRVALRSNLSGVQSDGYRVTSFRVKDYSGNSLDIMARKFVIACGGIENSRLLLHFNRQTNGRLVNNPDVLGRYWMEHPHFHVGYAVFETPETGMLHFALTRAEMQALGILNCRLTVWPLRRDLGRRVLRAMACEAPSLVRSATRSVFGNRQCATRLLAASEQAPKADNRIVLDDRVTDRFGIPAPKLHWRKSALDRKTILRSTIKFGEFLARSGKGRLRIDRWLLEDEGFPGGDWLAGNHHMGGTRMSARAENGVVDQNLRVWGQDNLFVAGSSVFPAGGYANPTLSIVQLSLRLADHLAHELSA